MFPIMKVELGFLTRGDTNFKVAQSAHQLISSVGAWTSLFLDPFG